MNIKRRAFLAGLLASVALAPASKASPLLNPFMVLPVSAGGGGPYFYSAQSGSVTNTSTSVWVDGHTYTFAAADQAASSAYALFWMCRVQAVTTNHNPIVRVRQDGSSILANNITLGELQDDYHTISGIYVFTTAGSPADITFDMGFLSGSSGKADVFDLGRFFILKLGADDYYAQTGSSSSGTNTSESTVQDLAFTPAASGDYIIFQSIGIDMRTSTGQACRGHHYFDGADVGGQWSYKSYSTGARYDCHSVMAYKETLTGGVSKTASIMLYTTSASFAYNYQNPTILAIRADRFPNVYYTRSLSPNGSTTTSSTAVNIMTQTISPNATDHITFGYSQGSSNNANHTYTPLVSNGNTFAITRENGDSSSYNGQPNSGFVKQTMPGGSITQAAQGQITGGGTYILRDTAELLCLEITGMT